MKQQLNEVKRMQQLAGILNEKYGEEDASESPYKQKELTGNEKALALDRDAYFAKQKTNISLQNNKNTLIPSLKDAEELAYMASLSDPKLFFIVVNNGDKYQVIYRNLPYSTRFKSISIYKKGQKIKDPTNRV